MSDLSRFAYTKAINFRKLEHEKRPLLFVCFLFSVIFHAALALLITLQPPPPETPMPLTVEILFHQPTRKSSPVFFQSRTIRPRDYIYRELAPHFPEFPPISHELFPHEFALPLPDTVGLGELALSSLRYRGTIPEMPLIEPEEPLSVRKPRYEFSMRDELLSAEDYLDMQYQGNSRGIVFFNPEDKHSITGLIYMTYFFTSDHIRGNSTEAALFQQAYLSHLSEILQIYTDIKPVLTRALFIGSNLSFQWPYVHLSYSGSWDYLPYDVAAIRRMVKNGTFIMLDNTASSSHAKPADASFRAFIKDAFGSTARISIIPQDHPLFHCYFDFNEVPLGNEYEYAKREKIEFPDIKYYLEGIFIGDRLVGILSNKGYSEAWGNPHLAAARLGVNIIVYALRRSDGNAIKKQDANLSAGKRGDQMKLLDFNPE